ncbi:MAG: nucleotidyltransferase family protein [Verrucomicrobiota bacterium]
MTTAIIILAAGESSRMGRCKQLLEFQGVGLLDRCIATAIAIPEAQVIVVLGARAEEIRATLDPSVVAIVENPDWQNGMGSSIRSGLLAALATHPDLARAIFLTCDQPFLTPDILEKLIAAHDRTNCLIAASGYSATLGIPALFDHSLFPELLSLDGAGGARGIILKHRDRTTEIPFPDGAIDIDTPADHQRLGHFSNS